ncbi:hypothetical protein ONS96_001290 [Cadophora gregata f. sp. sojae]|nr:hypothetical protein ONS96_001290 [Cadophora gregata f. sp. sojae]
MSGEYQGSQAYGAQPAGNESVNRNTGSVVYSKPLVDLRGITPAIDCALNLTYSAGQSKSFGLPENWTFSFPFLIPGKSVTTQQRTYIIDPNWADETGYQSGLKYINDHGIKLENVVPSQPLPSGRPGQYAWRFQMTDGTLDYYDDTGKVLEHDDLFGNSVYYSYVDPQASPSTALVDYILDSWGQKVQFGYQSGEYLQITTPDGGQWQVNFSDQGVENVVDPIGNLTSFTYVEAASALSLSTIRHPTALTSRFEYQTLYYYDVNGNQCSLAAVQDHYRMDDTGDILSQTNYRFGEATSGCTYTGYTSGYRIGGLTDSLIDGNDDNYRYDTLISNLDAAGNILSATRVLFNYLHLPMQEFHYGVDQNSQLIESYQARYTYYIAIDQHARSTNYMYPTVTEQLHYNRTTNPPAYQGLRRSSATYDKYGCMLQNIEEIWDPAKQDYVKQKSTQSNYVRANWGGEMLQDETFIDEVSGFHRKVLYTLTDDQKQIQSSITQYQESGGQIQPWKTKSMRYDTNGRITSETISWSSGVRIPAGTVTSYTNQNIYRYDNDGFNIVTATDAQGHATITKYDMKSIQGPTVWKQLPLGQTETFSYDLLGRCIQHTDPFGNQTTTSYTLGTGGNTVTSTSPSGYVTRETFDVLGRKIEMRDNGVPSQQSSDPTRVLSRVSYNSLSLMVSAMDELGLVTTYNAYDAFNRVLSVTDPQGNVQTNVYDDSRLSTSHSINGDLRGTAQLDGYGRNVFTTSYADSGDTSIHYSLGKSYTYDGSGNVIQSSLLEIPTNGQPILLETTNSTFNVENSISRRLTSGKNDMTDNAYDTVQRDVVYDIFGSSYTQTKTVQYYNALPTEHPGAINIRDNCNLLTTYRNQMAQEEKYAYDANGNMTTLTRFDGSQVFYTADALGRLTSVTGSSQNLSKSYFENGRVSQISTDVGKTDYKYALDGCAVAVTYSDTAQQTYQLDQYSRVFQDSDALQTVYQNSFDEQGRISSRKSTTNTITFSYGVVNHTKGELIGNEIRGSQTIKKDLSYDGFGRVNRLVVTQSQSQKTLLDVNYTYNSKGKLQEVVVSSEALPSVPESNYRRELLYDGLGQLRQDTTVYTNTNVSTTREYLYDGNSNILSITVDCKTMNRSYNSIDQRTDPGFQYDLNGRQISDDTGRRYSYASDDQLLMVTNQQAQVSFGYHANGALSSQDSSLGQTTFYYDSGSVNATETKGAQPSGASYLLASGSRVAAQSADGSSPSTYFIESQGSIALKMAGAGDTSSYYEAYGAKIESSTSPTATPAYEFGFQQELTDTMSGLVYLRSRWYQPTQGSFITMDSSHKENRYAFCSGDPVNLFDGTGHSATGAMIAGLVVGIAATVVAGVLTGGAAAAVFGPECISASIAAGAVSGAAGSVAGDGTQAAINGEKFTAARAGIDLASGFIGGAVGAGSGGTAGRAAMASAFEAGWSQRAVTAVGTAVSGTIGGASGSFASGETAALLTGQPLFSSDTALALVTGAVTGLGGGILESGSYLGITDNRIMPVAVRSAEVQGSTAKFEIANPTPRRPGGILHSLTPQAETNRDDLWFQARNRPASDALRIPGHADPYDTVVAHGSGNTVFPNMTTTVKGTDVTYLRPMKGKLFAQHLVDDGWVSGFRTGPIKLTVCFGGWSNAQLIADALQRDVWASYGTVVMSGEGSNWRLFTPRPVG